MFFITNGVVKVTLHKKDTGETIDLAEMNRGDAFGEMGVLSDNSVRSCNIIAKTFCELNVLGKMDVDDIRMECEDVNENLQLILEQRMEADAARKRAADDESGSDSDWSGSSYSSSYDSDDEEHDVFGDGGPGNAIGNALKHTRKRMTLLFSSNNSPAGSPQPEAGSIKSKGAFGFNNAFTKTANHLVIECNDEEEDEDEMDEEIEGGEKKSKLPQDEALLQSGVRLSKLGDSIDEEGELSETGEKMAKSRSRKGSLDDDPAVLDKEIEEIDAKIMEIGEKQEQEGELSDVEIDLVTQHKARKMRLEIHKSRVVRRAEEGGKKKKGTPGIIKKRAEVVGSPGMSPTHARRRKAAFQGAKKQKVTLTAAKNAKDDNQNTFAKSMRAFAMGSGESEPSPDHDSFFSGEALSAGLAKKKDKKDDGESATLRTLKKKEASAKKDDEV